MIFGITDKTDAGTFSSGHSVPETRGRIRPGRFPSAARRGRPSSLRHFIHRGEDDPGGPGTAAYIGLRRRAFESEAGRVGKPLVYGTDQPSCVRYRCGGP